MKRNKNNLTRVKSYGFSRVFRSFGKRKSKAALEKSCSGGLTVKAIDGSVLLVSSDNALADVVSEQKKHFQNSNARLLKRLQELKSVSG